MIIGRVETGGRALLVGRVIEVLVPKQAPAASIYRRIRKARGREIDLEIAACALACNACLWTLNLSDFDDIPDLQASLPGVW